MQTLGGKRSIYHVRVMYPLTSKREWRDVQGYKVVITGFEEFEFFVHRGFDRGILDDGLWRISEATTGFAFPHETDGTTRQAAIDRVTSFLSCKGKAKFINAIGIANH